MVNGWAGSKTKDVGGGDFDWICVRQLYSMIVQAHQNYGRGAPEKKLELQPATNIAGQI